MTILDKILNSFTNRFVNNVRFGFATNSSSSHSMVYTKNSQYDESSANVNDWMAAGNEFGWEDFRIDTLGTKLFYTLVGRIGGKYTSDLEVPYLIEEYGDEFPEFRDHPDAVDIFGTAAKGYVDHESRYFSPIAARDPKTVFFGGNDNGGESYEREQAFDEIDWDKTEPTWDEQERVESLKKKQKRAAASGAAIPTTVPKPRYHISPKTGNPNLCHAEKRPCPLGEGVEHYSTKAEARWAFEMKMEEAHNSLHR